MNTKKTYLFYDIETTGLNKSFDQILQFAAIRTDIELNELERTSIFFKLNPDTIPAPQAIFTHQLLIDDLQRLGIVEYEAIKQIHQLFNTPFTISIGYNSLGFDDEFLRFAFYKNLLPPYTHQYANGCGRMDLYPMMVMYYLFKHDLLQWPKINDETTLRLEHLAAANNIVLGSAHDALVDTAATLHLARLLFHERKMWDYLCGYFDKSTDSERGVKLSVAVSGENYMHRAGLMIDGVYGAKNFYQMPVLDLGWHNHYKNQILWLSLDSPQLTATTESSISETTFVNRKRFGESPMLLPLDAHYSKYLSAERKELVQSNIKWLRENPKILSAIIHYYKEYKYPLVPEQDIDSALYQNGFLSDFEQTQCKQFHNAATLTEKIQMLERFKSDKLRTQALRLLGRNYRSELPEYLSQEFQAYLQKIYTEESATALVDYRNEKRLILSEANAELRRLLQVSNLNAKQKNALLSLEKYFNTCNT